MTQCLLDKITSLHSLAHLGMKITFNFFVGHTGYVNLLQ